VAGLVLDTGALIAIERGDRRVGALLHEIARMGIDAVTSSACIAEAWRDPARQARLIRALAGIVERPLDPDQARRCGLLLARSRTSQIADAAIALLASDDDTVLTSDPDDIRHLLRSRPSSATVHAI
jgi:predicted nucleic acid-binding protein